MSRSYNEHHKMSRNEKQPSEYLDKDGNVHRNRKTKPYGLKGWCGYGGECYAKRIGYYMIDLVNKVKARRDAKKQIRKEMENNEEA